MRLLEHETSRAIRFFRVDSEEHGPHMARAFMDRYEFMQGPTTVEHYDMKAGVLFRGGHFNGHEIDRVQLYDVGMLAEGKEDTQALDQFIDDVMTWAQTQRRLKILPTEMPITKTYLSQLIVEFAPTPVPPNAASQSIMSAFSEAMQSSGLPPVLVNIGGFSITPDPASGANWNFRFERRVGEPFSANKFFSSAPLSTGVHLELIEKFERIFSAQPNAS